MESQVATLGARCGPGSVVPRTLPNRTGMQTQVPESLSGGVVSERPF